MPPCGCGGSEQPRETRRQEVVRPVSPATVPGGPGEDGYTWNGPQKPKAAARPAPVTK